jgi:predicted transcriptional regulator
MKYRSREELLWMIVRAAQKAEGVSRTCLMHDAYMSFMQIEPYLIFLSEVESLLTFDKINQLYFVTEKGLRFLQIYEEIIDMVAPEYVKSRMEAEPSYGWIV